MVLETPAAFDAAPGVPGDKAILVYAGLGQTAASVEPADWMSRVLRGCSMPLEPSLHLLTDAVRQHLPQHLQRLDPNGKGIAHSIFVPAIVRDESQLYSIEYVITPAGQGFWRHVRHVIERADCADRAHHALQSADQELSTWPVSPGAGLGHCCDS